MNNKGWEPVYWIGLDIIENTRKLGEELTIGGDEITNPSHYCFSNIEPIQVIQEWKLNFCLGNAIKYIARAGKKGDRLEDLKKAKQYLEFEVKELEKKLDNNK